MVTTKQVRDVMRKHGVSSCEIWTNKYQGWPSDKRTVKCYFNRRNAMVEELIALAGADNVKVTPGAGHCYSGLGIVVYCVKG